MNDRERCPFGATLEGGAKPQQICNGPEHPAGELEYPRGQYQRAATEQFHNGPSLGTFSFGQASKPFHVLGALYHLKPLNRRSAPGFGLNATKIARNTDERLGLI
jgi:hypothetical protein